MVATVASPDATIGIRQNVSRAEYDAIPAVNQSALKGFRRSAAHARLYLDGQHQPTADQQLGTLIHLYLLQPDVFSRDVVTMPDFTAGLTDDKGNEYANPRATKKYKALVAEFEADHEGKQVIGPADMDLLVSIGESVAGCEMAVHLLSAPGSTEVAVVWRDERTGLLCKALMDRVVGLDGSTVVVDIKSVVDASPGAFSRDCAKYGYHIQVPYYLDGFDALAPAARRFLHVAVEKSPPFGVAVYELDEEAIIQGRVEYRAYLDQYAGCLRTGRWDGYPDRVEVLSLPRYAVSEIGRAHV